MKVRVKKIAKVKQIRVKRRKTKESRVNLRFKKRGKLNLAQLLYENEEGQAQNKKKASLGFTGYLDCANYKSDGLPSLPFCSVCKYWGKYTCTRCGTRYCSMQCGEVHRETMCMKFAE